MSIKKLFDSTNKSRKYLSGSTQAGAFSSVESARNVEALQKKQEAFIPHVNYEYPSQFARYGSAYLYYKAAIERIHDYYPYDGSSAELTEFYNKSLEIEKYIFNKKYPRRNGYAIFSPDSYGTVASITDGYALTNTLEYITFYGGPHTGSEGTSLKDSFPTEKNSQYQQANIYDTDIYRTEGLPTNYGQGTRQSNLKANFDTGTTVEFWLKTGSLNYATETRNQVIFDWWNGEETSSADYGRILIELTSSKNIDDDPMRPFMVTIQSGACTTKDFISLGDSSIATSSTGLGSWSHYAISMYNSGDSIKTDLFINGRLSDSVARVPYSLTSSTASRTWPTVVDDPYSSVDNLQGWWRLNSDLSSEGDAPDRSGNSRDGTFDSSDDRPAYSTSLYPSAYIQESSNTFDGSDTMINIGTAATWNALIGTTSDKTMTFAAWIRPTSLTSTHHILSMGGAVADNDGEVNFRILNNGSPELYASFTGDNGRWYSADSGLISADTWYHVAITYDASDVANNPVMYVDGVSVGVTEATTPVGTYEGIVTDACYIGDNGAGNQAFEGQLADVAIWNTILTADEIASIYSASKIKSATLTVEELQSKGAIGRIGALQTAPPGTSAAIGSGKLSGSMDEFRFWKDRRNALQIAKNWFVPVYGGTNTDISNTTLGVYYKFNEGITQTASVDSVVLDYSGRVSNGSWTGYTADGRSLNSAIVEANAAATEYKDPIIYAHHPDVISLKTDLLNRGTDHDINNNTSFSSLIPNWVHEEEDDDKTTDTKLISHIAGTYLDKLYLQIAALNTLKGPTYTSASYEPYPFGKHMPQSMGLYTPDTFIEATVLEKFMNRDDVSLFEGDLEEAKNLIYLNLYDNLAHIFKSKGTEKAVRNVFRCFNIDERLIRLNVYSNQHTYELKNNLKQTLREDKVLNFDDENSLYGVVYTATSGSDSNTTGYIYGSENSPAGQPKNVEEPYGFTVEADITFPAFSFKRPKYNKSYVSASLFGVVSASINADVGTTWASTDFCNFDVYAIRDKVNSKNVYFRLTSSIEPWPFPELTSSVFYNVYDNDRWNISVRLKPSNWPIGTAVSGTGLWNYDIEFRGVNTLLGNVQDSFLLTASLHRTLGKRFLRNAKRLYVGARRENVTGTAETRCDVLFSSIRYWGRYVENSDLDQHAADIDNVGISGSYQSISPLNTATRNYDLLNNKMLFLDWNFNLVTGSDSSGEFYVQDMSSGSAVRTTDYGWLGNYSEYQHTGYGYGFATGSGDVVKKQIDNSFKFIDPESPVSSEMIQILSKDDMVLNSLDITENVPGYFYTLEKSLYNAISEEMLDFFAGAIDFNNLIGDPVNRYRDRYKALEKLRETFFRRVNSVATVEKYVTYYKWFDDALTSIISQLLPASADFVDDVLNTVESHVLERNKYQSRYPFFRFTKDPDPPLMGINEKTYNWRLNHHPVNNRQNTNSPWWRERADRVANTVISSSDAAVNTDRDLLRQSIENNNDQSASLFSTTARTGYYGSTFAWRKLAQPTRLLSARTQTYKGGVNFKDTKNLQFTYNALYPAGPVNKTSKVFVPENVLLAFTDDAVELKDTVDVTDPNKKVRRYFKVNHGRDWEDGMGYSNVKSSYAFPFNIFSSSMTSGSLSSGYNKRVLERVSESLEITNLHFDAYGPDLEVPMQGAFTNYAVGGHQSRHIKLNTGSDDYTNRPEAWKIVLGTCDSDDSPATGAVGMVGADYPWPEANAEGQIPYPMTASQKAVYYRDFVAKRPVNIRNIHHKTGSTILGNYSHNYEIVSTVGAYSNPRGFVENPPTLPDQILENASSSQGRSIFDIHRTEAKHIQFIPDYSIEYLYSTRNKSVISGRFAAPGGIETMGPGYKDLRAAEYSVYNTINYRNLTVKKPSQGPSGTISPTASVAGTPGIRVSDIHGKDFGLRSHLSRHAARFGRDSLHVTNPGASYDQLPAMFKINRNRKPLLVTDGQGGVATSSQYDNFWVQHQIPRSDRQYAWVTNSLAQNSSDIRYYGYGIIGGPFAGRYSGSTGYSAFLNFVTASDVCKPADRTGGSNDFLQSTVRLNLFTVDPVNDVGVTGISNSVGLGLNAGMLKYLNLNLTDDVGVTNQFNRKADAFNLLMTRRGSTYGWTWKRTRQEDNPVLQLQRRQNLYSIYDESRIKNYTMRPASMRGLPARINITVDGTDATFVATHNNENIYFNAVDLDNILIGAGTEKATPFEVLVDVAHSSSDYTINWITYSEILFPSLENERSASTYKRPSYNNRMWRDAEEARVNVGSTQVITNSFGVIVSQSCWPLDPPQGFLTRSSNPIITTTSIVTLRNKQPAGQLQNAYSQVAQALPAPLSSSGEALRGRNLITAPLYARKHCLPSPRSVASPSSVKIPQTGALTHVFNDKIEKFGGEAAWDAAKDAGRIIKRGSTYSFQSQSSRPWFNDYDDYSYELQLIGKNYSIVPEFRISEHIDYFVANSLLDADDLYEIPGTNVNSTTSSFWVDYSNSEFMNGFLGIKNLSELEPSQIMLVCSGVLRPNFYKGFYPAQWTTTMVNQFSKSYGKSLSTDFRDTVTQFKDGNTRPTLNALFSPGILYNSIKSGIAVDYPIVVDPARIRTASFGSSTDETPNWMLTNNWQADITDTQGYLGGPYFDYRIPFEAIMTPEKYLDGVRFYNMEPDPSCSLDLTATFSANPTDSIYTMMMSNFLAETANFFLKDSTFTKLRSDVVPTDLKFSRGDMYFGRLSLGQSYSGIRTYQHESGASGDNLAYSKFGAKQFVNGNFVSGTSYPIPQYPRQNGTFRRNHLMYSRPTAFGPPCAAQPTGALGIRNPYVSASSPLDSMYGFNPSFTPPYYDGEAWIDCIFYPTASVSYDLERILAEMKFITWRFDAGPSASAAPPTKDSNSPHGGMAGTQLIATFSGTIGCPQGALILEGQNINDNAMQLTASLNYLGVERVFKERTAFPSMTKVEENEAIGMRWVIQPKWETPILNFSDNSIRPISEDAGTLSIPQFASASVPRGMWHQFGVIPQKSDVGIFLQMGEIPPSWLKYHPYVNATASVYNDNNLTLANKIMKKARPLTDIISFSDSSDKVKLGELAESTTIREAIVAIPYKLAGNTFGLGDDVTNIQVSEEKKFFSIPQERVDACLEDSIGTADGDSTEAAGASIRKLVQKMQRYVLPPEFDWLNNTDIEPMAMYMFEFEYKLDKDDLSYIWQNLAPRDYKKITLEAQSDAHDLLDNELLNADNLMEEDLRWIVFKVKQRAQTQYLDLLASKAGQSFKPSTGTTTKNGYPLQFNWPYDYISFVELVKFETQVLYTQPEAPATIMVGPITAFGSSEEEDEGVPDDDIMI